MGKLLVFGIIVAITFNSAFAVINGKVDYHIPIDYTKLNKNELEQQADIYYNIAIRTNQFDDNTTSALNLYTILSNKEPYNITYLLRLGKLYDIIGKDRYAKGNYYHAIGINSASPEPFFYLGEFYYKRESYKKALKFYKLAYEKGYKAHYQTLYKLGDIYRKFGDSENAILYLQNAHDIDAGNKNLQEIISEIKNMNYINKEYYK